MRPKNPTIYPTYTQQIEQLEFGLYRRLNGVSDASARPAVYGNESIFAPPARGIFCLCYVHVIHQTAAQQTSKTPYVYETSHFCCIN